MNVEINGTEYCIVNIYAPSNTPERNIFFKDISRLVKKHAVNKANILLGGDFNSVTSSKDRTSKIIDSSSQALIKLMSSLSLVDVWRKHNPEKLQYTFIDPSFNL